ncbi:MAG: pilin [Candidatus Paceibacterota bacterium]
MFKTKTKRLFFASILIFLFLNFAPALAAEECPECDTLVCCGNEGQAPCTFDDFMCMISRTINFVMFNIVPPIAVVTIVIAAINLMTSSGDPSKLDQARKTLIWIILGLVVIYGAWAIVTGFITALGGGGDVFQFFKKEE